MSYTRRTCLAAVGALLISQPLANAAERMSYDKKSFEDAFASGRSILVHVTAPWCGECKKQKPIVAELAGRAEFKDLLIFDVDFDTQKGALRDLRVEKQSTLLAFKAQREVARLVGDTRLTSIEALMRQAM